MPNLTAEQLQTWSFKRCLEEVQFNWGVVLKISISFNPWDEIKIWPEILIEIPYPPHRDELNGMHVVSLPMIDVHMQPLDTQFKLALALWEMEVDQWMRL